MLPILAGFAVTGCMTLDDWSEAPGTYRDDYGYPAPVGWWGQDAASIDLFYGPLSRYGRWDSYLGYGMVFWPSGVGAGWQPYSYGYWASDPRYGRRWVSREPFGWATYHYGRWGKDPRRGWFWVPDRRFAGSWVDWHSGGGYSSWSPRAPYGYYGGPNWIHVPSEWAGRRDMYNHVRPGRPGYDGRPGDNDRPPRGDGRPPRNEQAGDTRPPFRVPDNSHPRSAPVWRGEANAPVASRPEARPPTASRPDSRPPAGWRNGVRQPEGQGFKRGERQPPRNWQQGERAGVNAQPGQQQRPQSGTRPAPQSGAQNVAAHPAPAPRPQAVSPRSSERPSTRTARTQGREAAPRVDER